MCNFITPMQLMEHLLMLSAFNEVPEGGEFKASVGTVAHLRDV